MMIKRYVDIICLNDKNGYIKPLYLIWDNDKKIAITKIESICPKASLRSGETGLQYTCIFENNNIRHLYYDRGKWYVELLMV